MMYGVIRRYELTDAEWESLSPHLPSVITGGRPREDDRRVLNGIVWKIRSGAPWRDVPARYGSWKSICTRFRRWALNGTFTKIHLACDGAGRVLAFVLSGGNVNDCTRFEQVMNALRVERIRPGRPRARPDHVIADKGYSTRAIRRYLRRRGIAHTIPERCGQQKHRRNRGPRGGRPPTFNKLIYRHRDVVERCFNRLKQCRSVATRYDQHIVPGHRHHRRAAAVAMALWRHGLAR